MGIFSPNPPPARKEVDPRIQQAKDLPGSINICVGPGNCGKTDFAERMSLVSACLFRLPWYGYDSGGDVTKHFDRICQFYRLMIEFCRASLQLRTRFQEGDARKRGKMAYEQFARPIGGEWRSLPNSLARAWLDPAGEYKGSPPPPPPWEHLDSTLQLAWTKPEGREELARTRLLYIEKQRPRIFYGPTKLPLVVETMRKWIQESREKAAHGHGETYPRAIVFIDEAGAVRAEFEMFWDDMRQARNAGVTLWTAGHRLTDLRPAALAVARNKFVWRPTDRNYVEVVRGVKIKGDRFTEHKSNTIKYIVGDDYQNIRTWDRAKYPEQYPPEIIVPAWPTVGRLAGM